MHDPKFWTASAEAMEMSAEGNRLIAAKIADWLGDVGRRGVRFVAGLMRAAGKHGHLPPV